MYLLAINQALPYGCSFVTYGHPEGSAAGDITIIWNDALKKSVDCAHPFLSFIYFLLPSPSHGVPSFLGLAFELSRRSRSMRAKAYGSVLFSASKPYLIMGFF